ncbi:MAG TPA: LuxR C-terminal-related transcriptional regulator [Anaerolineales bacterium]|nr:LuxR C-terminal-related transcriptional regulator [Anaerolineales bacterium]
MPSPSIPKTKLRPPALRQPVVARPRLTKIFREPCPLTVICAPAGSGKTTLALAWVTSQSANVSWLSLDTDDNDPIRFIRGFTAALQMAGEKLHLPAGQRGLNGIMTDLINQLGETDPILFVLDDYHVITEESIHSALAYFLDHIPASIQLVLVTREEPSLPLARLRARGQLRELDLQDLRFTVEEAATFLNQVMGLNLTRDQVHSLEERTQGWIAGLQMAGLSLQANKGHAIPAVNERQFIAEYLLTEILNQQEPDVQTFLLHTSILDQFSLPLCRAMISSNAGKVLAQIQRANLFITTVGSWYQYHPLFREFLQLQLKTNFPERVEELHRQASQWFEQNGMIPESIQHAFAMSDYETAANLISSLAPDYLKRGELVTLRRWLEPLPESLIWNEPRLCLTQVWLLLDSNLQIDAQNYFDRLGSFLEKNLRGEFLAVRALHAAMTHQPELAMKFVKRAQKSAEAKDPFIQTYVSFGLGAAQKMGLNFFQAEQSFRDSLALADADGNSYIAIASLVNLADVLYLQARLFDAENICRQALKRFADTTPDACHWYWTLGRIAHQRNELESALHVTNRAVELSASAQERTMHSRTLLQRAVIQYALNQKKMAQADLDSADQLARGLQDSVILRLVIRQRVLFAVEEGEIESARRWLETLSGYGEQPFPFYNDYARGRVLIAGQKYSRAHAQFEAALKNLEDADYALVRIDVLVWQAVCLGMLGKYAAGEKVLKRAVKAAQTERVIRPFIEARQGLSLLIEQTGRNEFDWVADLVAGRSQAESPALTRREREILQLLSMGLSNQEMAEKLVIAEGTLKRHVANLYQKLGVHNRAQAVRHFHQQ